MEKIKLDHLCKGDLHVISDAASKYAETLSTLCASCNLSQQHIHLSIIRLLGYDVFKKITNRTPVKNPTLNMELHEAFVFYDALQHYSHFAVGKEAAVVRRLIIQLFAMLPYTADHDKMSLQSKLNYGEE